MRWRSNSAHTEHPRAQLPPQRAGRSSNHTVLPRACPGAAKDPYVAVHASPKRSYLPPMQVLRPPPCLWRCSARVSAQEPTSSFLPSHSALVSASKHDCRGACRSCAGLLGVAGAEDCRRRRHNPIFPQTCFELRGHMVGRSGQALATAIIDPPRCPQMQRLGTPTRSPAAIITFFRSSSPCHMMYFAMHFPR